MNKISFLNIYNQDKKIHKKIIKKISESIKNNNFILSDEVKNFEKNFSNFCNSKYTVGVGNGTDALYLSIKVLNLKRGDEVVTSGGIVGKIEKVYEDDKIDLIISENVNVQVIKSTVQSLLKDPKIKK